MKNNKICFSRTLAYLVLLVVAVVGAFYIMNVVNTQKIGANPEAGAAPKNCMYGTQIVTDTSTPYKWNSDASTDGNHFCIQKDNKNIGYRCKTIVVGATITINATGSLIDTTMCPLPSTARTECYYGTKKLSEYNPDYTLDADNCIKTGAGAWTGYYCSDSFVTTYNLTKCPRAAAVRAGCLVNGKALSSQAEYDVTVATRCITYKGKNTGWKCDLTTFKNSWDTTTCPTTTARTECSYGGKKLTEYDPDYTLNTDRCILTGTDAWTGYYCSDSFVTTYNLTKCPRAGRSACQYKGAAATVDVNDCITDGGAWTGYYCNPTTFMSGSDLTRCPRPAAAARTECQFGGYPLSYWKTKTNAVRYTVEAATGCVLDKETVANGGHDGFNNGLWCNQTNFRTNWDSTTCPL